MSSLLQFSGAVNTKGVGLEFYLTDTGKTLGNDTEPVSCMKCEKHHAQLYVAFRKPKGMCGCWVVFEYNGEEHVPDLSVPIAVGKVPVGARKLNAEENAEYWHRQ